ncbi:glycosyltransferase family 2 protein [Fervidibacter sacchari]|jgi:Glycosyltransferases involved in cell wall biogenesis
MTYELQTTTEQTAEAKAPEVSIVIPCLNEENSIGIVVEKAKRAIEMMGVSGEVIVADNGSTDRSVEIALSKGARVVHVAQKGYGNALRGGIEAARGRIIVIGDADDSYDFLEAPKLVEKIREGYDLVVGSRFKGRILPGAMPWTSKIGNPIMTFTLNLLFKVNTSDSQSGMRAFTKEAYRKMQLQATGMEFASEMLIKAGKAKLRIAEVPITLHPDKRGRPPHLRPIRDGWRHLKLMLTYSPTVLFLIPGLTLMLIGLALMGSQLLAPMDKPIWLFGRLKMDFHWAILGSLLTLTGYQVITAHFMAKIYSVTHRFQEQDRWLEIGFRYLNAERVLALSLLAIAIGLWMDGWVLWDWLKRGYGELVSGHTRLVIFGSTLIALGIQTFFNAFVFSILCESAKNNKLAGAP